MFAARFALLALAVVLAARGAAASPLDVEQEPFVARTVTFLRPVRLYVDPSAEGHRTAHQEVVVADLEAAVARLITRDPRWRLVEFRTAALEASRRDEQQDALAIARQSARLAAEYMQTQNLSSAAAELETALASYDRTLAHWIFEDEVAAAYRALALVHLEQAAERAGDGDHRARADVALSWMIRTAPGAVLSENAYPASVVGAYRAAYVAHFANGGVVLAPRADELERAGRLVDADVVISAALITDARGTRLRIVALDRAWRRLIVDTTDDVTPTTEAIAGVLARQLSRGLECLSRTAPPAPARPTDRGHSWVDFSVSSGLYVSGPTSERFYNGGVQLGVTHMVQDTFGLTAGFTQWTAPRDPNGELLRSLETTRLFAGALVGARVGSRGRARLHGIGGVDLSRVGDVLATDEFWCKVSRGDPMVFDTERECRETDLIDLSPLLQWGVQIGVGADLLVAGPFWLHTRATGTLFVAPANRARSVDSPVSLDLGLQYRF